MAGRKSATNNLKQGGTKGCIMCRQRPDGHLSRFCRECRQSTDRLAVIPGEYDFPDDHTCMAAPELGAIGKELVAAYDDFADIRLYAPSIDYLWKKKGGKKNGVDILGRIQKPTGELKYYSQADYVVWLAADNCSEFSRYGITAVVFHELLHVHYNDEEQCMDLRGHEFEGFGRELEVFGLWKPGIRDMADAFATAAAQDRTRRPQRGKV